MERIPVMCCYRINTEVLLANLFAGSSEYPISYTVNNLNEYLRFLYERFPTYLATNFSEQAVYDCTVQYPELYLLSTNKEGVMVVKSGGFRPNLDYFNSPYSTGVRNFIKGITNAYLKENQQVM